MIFGKDTLLKSSVICKHRKTEGVLFPILAQIFGFKSLHMHFLPFQYILNVGFIFCTKAARFKALKQQYPVIAIILLSEQEQFGFGGSFLFFDVSSVKAILVAPLLSLCAHPRSVPLSQPRSSLGAGQSRPAPPSPSAATAITAPIAPLCSQRLCKFT